MVAAASLTCLVTRTQVALLKQQLSANFVRSPLSNPRFREKDGVSVWDGLDHDALAGTFLG
jgi:hypothetical protein